MLDDQLEALHACYMIEDMYQSIGTHQNVETLQEIIDEPPTEEGCVIMVDKTDSERVAWLEGYKAAAETAASLKVRIGGGVDETLNIGISMVADLLAGQVVTFQAQNEPQRCTECTCDLGGEHCKWIMPSNET